MQSENNIDEIQFEVQKNSLNKVTPLSKYLAMVLFVLLPFIGGWVGYTYAPEKVIEIERVTVVEKMKTLDSEMQAITHSTVVMDPHTFPNFVGGIRMQLPQGWLINIKGEGREDGLLLTSPDYKMGTRGVDSFVEQGMEITITRQQTSYFSPETYLTAMEEVVGNDCSNCRPSQRITIGGENALRESAYNIGHGMGADGVFIGGNTKVSMVRQGQIMEIHINYAETLENEALIKQILESITFDS